MNSPFANIFIALQSRIQDQVSAITYIDQDLGQLKNETRPAVTFPCVLIDFEDFEFQALADNVQTAEGTIILQLGFTPASSSSSTTPIDFRETAISYYDIEWNLHKALQGWSPGDGFGYLTRKSTITQKRHSYLRVREIRYRIAFPDYSTKPTIQQTTATLNYQTQINH